ncbi:MAG: hypothetical protein EOO11_04970 [Chitinophagaceae bacterium]|nr:MAG: hypothetical protein EOO11_04970 [Chitinophagaceae bacterium]
MQHAPGGGSGHKKKRPAARFQVRKAGRFRKDLEDTRSGKAGWFVNGFGLKTDRSEIQRIGFKKSDDSGGFQRIGFKKVDQVRFF